MTLLLPSLLLVMTVLLSARWIATQHTTTTEWQPCDYYRTRALEEQIIKRIESKMIDRFDESETRQTTQMERLSQQDMRQPLTNLETLLTSKLDALMERQIQQSALLSNTNPETRLTSKLDALMERLIQQSALLSYTDPETRLTSKLDALMERLIQQSAVLSNMVVRLVNGNGTHPPRLEVLHNGVWGTVCDDAFSNVDAQVVCRSLGFRSGSASEEALWGSGQIWLDEVGCTGSEIRIEQCPHAKWGENDCSHSEDVGVICV